MAACERRAAGRTALQSAFCKLLSERSPTRAKSSCRPSHAVRGPSWFVRGSCAAAALDKLEKSPKRPCCWFGVERAPGRPSRCARLPTTFSSVSAGHIWDLRSEQVGTGAGIPVTASHTRTRTRGHVHARPRTRKLRAQTARAAREAGGGGDGGRAPLVCSRSASEGSDTSVPTPGIERLEQKLEFRRASSCARCAECSVKRNARACLQPFLSYRVIALFGSC